MSDLKVGDRVKYTGSFSHGLMDQNGVVVAECTHGRDNTLVQFEKGEQQSIMRCNVTLVSKASPATLPGAPTILGTQVGGSHYTDCKIQPIEYIWANKLGFSEGNIIKYVTRWRSKGGVKDLEKAKHHIALLIEHTLADEAEYKETHGGS